MEADNIPQFSRILFYSDQKLGLLAFIQPSRNILRLSKRTKNFTTRITRFWFWIFFVNRSEHNKNRVKILVKHFYSLSKTKYQNTANQKTQIKDSTELTPTLSWEYWNVELFSFINFGAILIFVRKFARKNLEKV